MENVIIKNPEELKRLKEGIYEGGAEKLHVLADFDKTLTTAFVDGKSVPSLISILRNERYLTPDYAQKANGLYEKYHPIEIDSRLPLEKKKEFMREWWETHFDLLIKSGLNKKDLEKVVASEKVQLREGCEEFIDFLKANKIPLIILSSSGLGGDIISMFLEKEDKLYDNICIISNSYEWDERGNAVAVKQPIIHGMNKDETLIRDLPVFNVIQNRKNVLLLGDNLEDIAMVKGFDCDNLIKIGFLNENVGENLEAYKNNYDIVILNDSSMDYVNDLLKEIVKI